MKFFKRNRDRSRFLAEQLNRNGQQAEIILREHGDQVEPILPESHRGILNTQAVMELPISSKTASKEITESVFNTLMACFEDEEVADCLEYRAKTAIHLGVDLALTKLCEDSQQVSAGFFGCGQDPL